MSVSWYYVKGSERVGPVSEGDLEGLVAQGQVGAETYVWRKGLQNWERLKNMQELGHLLAPQESQEEIEEVVELEDAPPAHEAPVASTKGPDWPKINPSEPLFTIKIGPDRGGPEAEYGPFSLERLRLLFEENRINGKTLVFSPGMATWQFLGELPLYSKLTPQMPPVIEERDRRLAQRRPFVARMLFHDNKKVYEGICRDISIGGLQVLVAGFPGKVGDKVTLNVHPDNGQLCFTASGKVVRLLEGGSGLSLRFVDLGPEARSAIDSYIQSVEV